MQLQRVVARAVASTGVEEGGPHRFAELHDLHHVQIRGQDARRVGDRNHDRQQLGEDRRRLHAQLAALEQRLRLDVGEEDVRVGHGLVEEARALRVAGREEDVLDQPFVACVGAVEVHPRRVRFGDEVDEQEAARRAPPRLPRPRVDERPQRRVGRPPQEVAQGPLHEFTALDGAAVVDVVRGDDAVRDLWRRPRVAEEEEAPEHLAHVDGARSVDVDELEEREEDAGQRLENVDGAGCHRVPRAKKSSNTTPKIRKPPLRRALMSRRVR
mmetsp:Transcript_19661/g.67736  ORF Transcript_19661/g.67736 Transcript_19661/m.67736 type:complete len:270 (-) Transcript_19661:769-1578(-)